MKLIILLALFPFFVVGAFEHQAFVQRPEPIRSIIARAASACTDDISYCLNCQTLYDCDKEVEVDCSSISTVCGDASGVAGCFSSFDNYDTIPKPTNNECLCRTQTHGGQLLANGAYQDPFDANYYVTCTGGVATFSNCSEGEIYHEGQAACVQGIDCDGKSEKIEDPLNCGIYYDCTEGGIQKNCALGQIFDASANAGVGDCVNPMAGACTFTDFTLFQNPHACYIGLRCDGNSEIVHCESCSRTDIFGATSLICEPDDQCDPLTPLCMQEYWEKNNECNKCTDAITSYATRVDCSEYYYQCEDDGAGGFTPDLVKCDEGLYYDPNQGICDVPNASFGC